jgi:hypothetical protein
VVVLANLMTDNESKSTPQSMQIVRCVSCDGYGWEIDDFTGDAVDCSWCDGTGYLYRDSAGVDHRIPATDYGKVQAQLERLEQDRLREMGYSGTARHPDEQPIRRSNTALEDADSSDNDPG